MLVSVVIIVLDLLRNELVGMFCSRSNGAIQPNVHLNSNTAKQAKNQQGLIFAFLVLHDCWLKMFC